MRSRTFLACAWFACWLCPASYCLSAPVQPLRLHPDNPHYFLFRGKPTILLTSGEHYGAVLNLDFDYIRYLDELRACGFNLTRTFSGTYPMNARNNVNRAGRGSRQEVYTLKDERLTAHQEALARRLVSELNDYDNVYFEVCNEPYFGGVTSAWTDRMVAAIVDAEKALPARHLIAQNIANGSARINKPNPQVSIFNFHYATPPDAVAANFGLNKVIADDETGFRGKDDRPYRFEGWEFLLAGGAIYSNLDYSFTCARPDGTATVTTSPGGGGPALRKQLRILKEFLDGFDLVRMRPNNAVVKGGTVTAPLLGNPPEARAGVRALVEVGKAYAIYIRGGAGADLVLEFPAGSYKAEWINTRTGKIDKKEAFAHKGATRTLTAPSYTEDIALRVLRSD